MPRKSGTDTGERFCAIELMGELGLEVAKDEE